MFAKRQMPLKMIFRWTYKTSFLLLLNAITPVLLITAFDFHFLKIPWSFVALVGTAVAFLISFQNNSAYDRVWEARKIWGGIVNATRTFSVFTRDMVDNNDQAVKTILYRHRAWLTALRFSMRQQKEWEIPEVVAKKQKAHFDKLRYNPERSESLEDSLRPLISSEEFEVVSKSPNKASTLLSLQSQQFSQLKKSGNIWEFNFIEIENMIKELFTLQGKSERIKNFPYPRQYFTLGLHLTWTFIFLLPYAIAPEFTKIGLEFGANTTLSPEVFTWFSVPFVACVSWIFHTMGRMGRAGENPFEGTIHDVPISAMARALEIEISHLLSEPKEMQPKPFPVRNSIYM